MQNDMKYSSRQDLLKRTIKKDDRRLRGFSFIEVMVVIIILGLLSSIVGVYLFDSAEKAKADATKTQIRGLETALDLYRPVSYTHLTLPTKRIV